MSDYRHFNRKQFFSSNPPPFAEIRRRTADVVIGLLRYDFYLSELTEALPDPPPEMIEQQEPFSVEANLLGAIEAAQLDGIRLAADCLLAALRASPSSLRAEHEAAQNGARHA